jgi:hypothetical protein
VGIVAGYGLDSQGLIPSRGKSFSLLHSIQPGSRAYPPSYLISMEEGGGKWRACEGDHSPPSSTEAMNGGAIPLLPHMS